MLAPARWPDRPIRCRSRERRCGADEAESFSRPFNYALRIRFSAARYSFRASSSWSTIPVTVGQDARPIHQSHPFRRSCLGHHGLLKKTRWKDSARLRQDWINLRLYLRFQFFDGTGFDTPATPFAAPRQQVLRHGHTLLRGAVGPWSNSTSRRKFCTDRHLTWTWPCRVERRATGSRSRQLDRQHAAREHGQHVPGVSRSFRVTLCLRVWVRSSAIRAVNWLGVLD